MLTDRQRHVAQQLRILRPAVLPGTNVIIDDLERSAYYECVTQAMQTRRVKLTDATEFCNICGICDIPD